MSKIIEELSNVPAWNTITGIIKIELTDKSDDFLDNISEDDLEHILWQYKGECTELVAKLLMIKIRDEWRKEGNDEFDSLIRKIKSKMSDEDLSAFEEYRRKYNAGEI